MAKAKEGICAYCLQQRKLCMSHAIPNRYIKELKIDGKHVTFDPRKSYTYFSGKGGEGPLLCSSCESHLNVLYDAPFQRIIDKLYKEKFIRASDSKTIGRALISFAWRASFLKSELYANFYLHPQGQKVLKKLITGAVTIPEKVYSLRILKIFDNSALGGIDPEFIAAAPRIKKQKIALHEHIIVIFMMCGYLFEIFIPKINKKHLDQLNIVNFNERIHTLKAIRITEVPGFIKLVEDMNQSVDNGRATKAVMDLMRDL